VVVYGLFRSAHRFTVWFTKILCHFVATTWVLDNLVWLVSESNRPGLEPVHVEKKCPFKDLWNTPTGEKTDISHIYLRYRLSQIFWDFFLS
jgi:hypothetical protein